MTDQTEAASSSDVRRIEPFEKHGIPAFDPELPSPNFFVVGAAKAGTTSLHAYLKKHPDVFMPDHKEPHYFSSFRTDPSLDNFVPVVRDAREYQELFCGSEQCKAVGEASPSYLCDGNAAIQIKAVVPNAKIIISLRNPVERAYSHYLMECREGRETRTFRDALEADLASSEKGWGVSLQYVELGLYADQVDRYLKVFGKPNVLVILFEDFIRDTAGVMQEVACFLDIEPTRFPDSAFDVVHHPFAASRGPIARWILRRRPIRIMSRRWIPQTLRRVVRDNFLFRQVKKPKLDDGVRKELADRFAVDLQRLELLLERDLGALRYDD